MSGSGIDWVTRDVSLSNWNSLAYGNGIYVAVANTQTASRVMYSSDLSNWTYSIHNDYRWTSITYGENLFVAVSYNYERVMTSIDASSWIFRTPTTSTTFTTWTSVTYGNGLFVAVANNPGKAMSSNDGIVWTAKLDFIGEQGNW